jgi:hypothetical protein
MNPFYTAAVFKVLDFFCLITVQTFYFCRRPPKFECSTVVANSVIDDTDPIRIVLLLAFSFCVPPRVGYRKFIARRETQALYITCMTPWRVNRTVEGHAAVQTDFSSLYIFIKSTTRVRTNIASITIGISIRGTHWTSVLVFLTAIKTMIA